MVKVSEIWKGAVMADVFYLFYLLIFGCIGSSLLHAGFL